MKTRSCACCQATAQDRREIRTELGPAMRQLGEPKVRKEQMSKNA